MTDALGAVSRRVWKVRLQEPRGERFRSTVTSEQGKARNARYAECRSALYLELAGAMDSGDG